MQCRDGGAGKSLEVSLRWSAWVERTERRVLEAERLEDRTCWRGEGAHLQWAYLCICPFCSRLAQAGVCCGTRRPLQLSRPPCLGGRFLSVPGITRGPDAGPHHTPWTPCRLGCELLAAPAGFWPRALQASLPVPLIAVCFSSMCGLQGHRGWIQIRVLLKKSFISYLLVLF